MSVKQRRVNTQGFKIKDEIWVFITRGRRVEPDFEFWIPEAHSLRAGITENGQSRVVGSPVDGLEEVVARAIFEGLDCPGKIIPNAVINPYNRG